MKNREYERISIHSSRLSLAEHHATRLAIVSTINNDSRVRFERRKKEMASLRKFTEEMRRTAEQPFPPLAEDFTSGLTARLMVELPIKKATPLGWWRDPAFSQRCILIGRGAMIRAGSDYDDASVLNRIIHNGCRNNGTARPEIEGSIKEGGHVFARRDEP